MKINDNGVRYEVHSERELEIALADIAERAAQREAIRRGFLRWSAKDEPTWRRLKRAAAAALVATTVVGSGACASPTAPTAGYECKTQPRLYTLPTGESRYEVDTYRSATPCPTTPIE